MYFKRKKNNKKYNKIMKFNKFRAIKISKAEIKKIINKYKEFNKKNHI
jgi:hypothetical protein